METWKKLIVAVALAGVALFAWRYGTDRKPEIRECPHDGVERELLGNLQAAVGNTADVPEYNDCQRFLVGSRDAPAYDSLYAIFAARLAELDTLPEVIDDLDALFLETDVAEPSSEEVLSSVVQAVSSTRHGQLAAVIRAEGDYPALNIREGFNCLALRRIAIRDTAIWVAAISQTTASQMCKGPLSLAGASELEVRENAPIGAGLKAYPPVARWGFDQDRWTQFAAIKCGEAVCYVGPRRFRPQGPPDAGRAIPPTAGRVRVHDVALWHDQQLLGTLPDQGSKAVPTPMLGTIIPHPDLGSYNSDADFSDKWTLVAEVELSEHSDEYVRKLNFGASGPDSRNEVYACLESSAGCPDFPPGKDCSHLDSGKERWRGKNVNAANGSAEYYCIRRFPQEGGTVEIPGTARWRWLKDDETLWFRCKSGCCEEEPST